ncbi:Glyoxalase superfamily enzyme, possibly 3-demethylubiquinone-9 3-methyltransferase [Lishizhenia tianjinensis]|uniref:Glyoxalase superfamily enzyme, possibly 3-demethylubiquinone-9 3-methyltransferase n=1 Tax=Lishizhenia tianjinensis TaxID=477690 RepID=A0A1I6XIZ1_9FLAO|nr:VOC family protein [Lishizhenia tianjinensis]SFT38309.1 Glyoxalase superfamily enzyme, possibly 3-demethylubiquinone-9 3-methyltransferase [Lishizhenia tianjinensis]
MQTTSFLTFVGGQCGKGLEAIELYTSLFPNSEIKRLDHYKEGEPGGAPDLIKFAEFTLNGTSYLLSESNYNHEWGFTPGVSILVRDNSEEQLQHLYNQLSTEGGQVMVPLDDYKGEGDYGFGRKFGWCADKFGVNWQFVLME